VRSLPDARSPASTAGLQGVFHDARRDPELAVLEGLHALKHALRFGAHVQCVVIVGPAQVRTLVQALAPDVAERILADALVVSPEMFAALAPQAPSTGVLALARRRPVDVAELLVAPRLAPIVLLEQPRNLGNLGACVRVAAAADVAGVLTTGVHDPWDPAALRGSAGLHFALPVARLGDAGLTRLGGVRLAQAAGSGADAGPEADAGPGGDIGSADTGPAADAGSGTDVGSEADIGSGADAGPEADIGPEADTAPRADVEVSRPLVAIDPDGEELRPGQLPSRAILAFGSERQGLSEALLGRADALVRLPMRDGVSSLNLATSVAALLYAWRLS
jgi:TrmH family RNA methyltransferase